MTSPRALITGGAGFIGTHLAKRLVQEGYHVDLLDNLSRGVQDQELERLCESGRVAVQVVDLLDRRQLEELDDSYTHVFHFAALLGVQNVLEHPEAVLRENVALLTNLLDLAARQRALERFVFPSTSEVYAGTQQFFELPIPSPENTPLAVSALDQPRTSYMLSKIYGEALCQHSGLPFTIVRPHNFYGPRMGLAHVMPQVLQRIHAAQDGDDLVVYSMDHRRTFCFIDDAVEYLVRLIDAEDAVGGTFNIGTQEPEVTMGQLAELLCDVVGRSLQIVPGETAPGSPPRRCPDMSRTIEVTDHRPAVSLTEGARRTYEWYRSNIFDGGGVSAR